MAFIVSSSTILRTVPPPGGGRNVMEDNSDLLTNVNLVASRRGMKTRGEGWRMRKWRHVKVFGGLMVCLLLIAAAGPAVLGAPKVSLTVLRVGADPSYRPISYTDKSGKMIGYDVDFATALAKRLGVPLHYEGVAWDGIIPALQSHKIDTITDMVITPEREKVVAFSEPYLQQGVTTVVRTNYPGNPGKSDLAKLRVGVMVNTSAADAVGHIPGVKPVTYNTVPDEYNDLILGRIDVVAVEGINAGYSAKAIYPGKLRVTGKELVDKPELIGAAFRKDDTALVTAANAAIRAMITDGTLQQINRKWFGNINLIPTR
ncbi:MAG TPA: ABC transporter substrate-binding protein [bacterium]|nr:ABC transporter substrate-binding protein [bacterium]